MKYRWGIVGIGDIAERGMAPALNRATDTALVSVFSRSLAKAKEFASRHNAAKAYDSLEQMLGDPDIDNVYIATPNSLHASQTILAAQAGKNVLCEKPMALTIRDCELMIEVCDKNKVRLGVVYQNRYHPAHLEARRQILAGAVGRIDLASAHLCRGFASSAEHWQEWRKDPSMSGSGAIVAQASHPVDLLRYLLDSEVQEVQAMTDEMPPQRPVDEMVYSLLKFKNGVHGIVVAGARVPRFDNDVLLYGSTAKIVCKGTLGIPRMSQGCEIIIESVAAETKKQFPHSSVPDKMVQLVDDFNRAVAQGAELGISGYNGMQMVKIAIAMQESSRQGKAFRIN